MKNNILIFAKTVNGQEIKREIRCQKSANDTHIKVQQAGGWKLIKTIG